VELAATILRLAVFVCTVVWLATFPVSLSV
jgi:hypothetical protein